jgi:hypothetical protein
MVFRGIYNLTGDKHTKPQMSGKHCANLSHRKPLPPIKISGKSFLLSSKSFGSNISKSFRRASFEQTYGLHDSDSEDEGENVDEFSGSPESNINKPPGIVFASSLIKSDI